jgi:hypothetical protein
MSRAASHLAASTDGLLAIHQRLGPCTARPCGLASPGRRTCTWDRMPGDTLVLVRSGTNGPGLAQQLEACLAHAAKISRPVGSVVAEAATSGAVPVARRRGLADLDVLEIRHLVMIDFARLTRNGADDPLDAMWRCGLIVHLVASGAVVSPGAIPYDMAKLISGLTDPRRRVRQAAAVLALQPPSGP